MLYQLYWLWNWGRVRNDDCADADDGEDGADQTNDFFRGQI